MLVVLAPAAPEPPVDGGIDHSTAYSGQCIIGLHSGWQSVCICAYSTLIVLRWCGWKMEPQWLCDCFTVLRECSTLFWVRDSTSTMDVNNLPFNSENFSLHLVYYSSSWWSGCLWGTGGWWVMSIITGVGSGGYAGHLTPQLFMWDIDMYISLEKI